MKLQCELYPSRHVALCLDPYCGLGFALWCLSSVYSGHHTLLIPPSEVESNPAVWLTAVSQYKVRDTFCSYGKLKLDVFMRSWVRSLLGTRFFSIKQSQKMMSNSHFFFHFSYLSLKLCKFINVEDSRGETKGAIV